GDNSGGQLGDGTSDAAAAPVGIAEPGFAWKVGRPVLDPPGGRYFGPQAVTLSCATPGATLHYSLDGAPPTESDPAVASGGTVVVADSATLTARAFKPGAPSSDTVSAEYVIDAFPSIALDPPGGTFSRTVQVRVSCLAGLGARYRTDGNPPTDAD